MDTAWTDKHQQYKAADWIDKPTLFAQIVAGYLPPNGRILELGAGQGQDSRYFAGLGHKVTSTDRDETALSESRAKLPAELEKKVSIEMVDMSVPLPYADRSFDLVYAHLALHYFDHATTVRIVSDISRILDRGGLLAFIVNSIHDPEFETGERLEDHYFRIGEFSKRYFSVADVEQFTPGFSPILLDDQGETYKDRAKGVHNLVRFIGTKSQ